MCSASVHMSRRGGPLPAGASLPTSRLGTPPAWRVSLPLQSYSEAACCTDKVQLEALCKAKHMQQEPALFNYSVTECRGHLKRADDCACRTVCSETLSNVVSLCTSCHTPQQMLREQGTRLCHQQLAGRVSEAWRSTGWPLAAAGRQDSLCSPIRRP